MVELDRLADALAEIRTVQIDRQRCLRCRSPRSICSACAVVCPEGAISPERLPEAAECSGCGLCAAACPADAIVLDNPSDQELLRRFARAARGRQTLTVACARATPPAGSDPVTVRCLGRLGPELLLAAAACGAGRIRLWVPDGGCGPCPSKAGAAMLQSAAAEARRVLAGLLHPCEIEVADASAVAEHTVSGPNFGLHRHPNSGPDQRPERPRVDLPPNSERRAFLRSALGLLRQALPAPAAAQAPEPFTPSASRRRELLLWALERLEGEAGAPPDGLAWGPAAVYLTGTCHRCDVCVRLCPNGAMRLDEGGLALFHRRCHACGLCTQVCPTGALSLGAPRPLSFLRSAAPDPLGAPQVLRCTACGREEQVVVASATAKAAGRRCLACTLRRPQPANPEVTGP
ncbi:ferredoxin [Symbiobacterium terraclitae]|uniref:Ferredoxin n=1 Tax=Symbiobacterium terraclitae TaxID=557451 RepID=A0ABS4JVM1_9FIRM|nr:4Fe-4S binding protein [Symbiobacterium terraclitae]MBP2019604.1 ferredoxin [Symbiobacterium terraclitae]